MLNSRGVSDALEQTYEDCKTKSRDVFDYVRHLGVPCVLLRDEDLIEQTRLNTLVYVQEGFLKLKSGHREIRMYTAGDFINFCCAWPRESSIISDFKSDLFKFDAVDVMHKLFENSEMLQKWIRLQTYEMQMILSLCGEYAPDTLDVEMVVKNYSKGDVIIAEGEVCAEVYEMITGRADVSISETVVGEVNNGELFGELGYFADDIHRATVTARQNCFVRVIDPLTFGRLLETNSQFAVTLLKTFATRLNRQNMALVDKHNRQN